ncbi:hypothetical protein EDF74_2088 [Stenotrophomonas rhizophila]|uniref:hypothetical protein n=1 Tax=Stenotrophomonas TaxID=40323 RepID=UPI000F4C13D7|nr:MULTISPECIES: hypothetical protein [Stenotrophomonas]MCW6027864.1 hypothetical protein [Stenotrophomonas sp. SRS1]ROP76435.1 hypothetical protein EDF74_2088 [Stenotrophomonas rhizophila]
MKRSLLLMVLVSLPAAADESVFFRCTDAGGSLTIQSVACPAGSEQRIQRISAPVRGPAVTGNAPTAPTTEYSMPPLPQDGDEASGLLDSAALRPEPSTAVQDAAGPPRPPLPEIYQCVSADGGRYLHEREPAPSRCESLALTGLGGSHAPSNAASCEVVRDACQPMAEEQRCSGWQQRFRDARGRERFAAPDNQAAATAERARLEAVLADSDCPVP